MLKITSIAGNIFENKELEKKYHSLNDRSLCESLKFSRQELEKKRMRKNTDKGSDVGLIFDDNSKLSHGDVLIIDDKFIFVEQLPEKILSVSQKSISKNKDLPVILGHIIGNMHRPISIEENSVSFPIQDDSELELFKKLFEEIIDDLDLKIQNKVFVPHKGMNVHEHG